jgi:hypothetical protein
MAGRRKGSLLVAAVDESAIGPLQTLTRHVIGIRLALMATIRKQCHK